MICAPKVGQTFGGVYFYGKKKEMRSRKDCGKPSQPRLYRKQAV